MFIIASIIGFLILFDYGIFIRRPEEKLIESNEGFMIFPKYIAVDKEKVRQYEPKRSHSFFATFPGSS